MSKNEQTSKFYENNILLDTYLDIWKFCSPRNSLKNLQSVRNQNIYKVDEENLNLNDSITTIYYDAWMALKDLLHILDPLFSPAKAANIKDLLVRILQYIWTCDIFVI